MLQIRITHFSDVLCVWAYVSQVRIDELRTQFRGQVELDYRLFPVFGNAPSKITSQWKDKGGLAAYARHVHEIAGGFEHISIHPDIWRKAVPNSSLPGHLALSAVRLAESAGEIAPGSYERYSWSLRKAFFSDCRNIADARVLAEVADEAGIKASALENRLANGEAHASLSEDMQMARDQTIRSSPTLIFNEDRQRLTGNVGYRIIEANIRELIERPQGEHSWC